MMFSPTRKDAGAKDIGFKKVFLSNETKIISVRGSEMSGGILIINNNNDNSGDPTPKNIVNIS